MLDQEYDFLFDSHTRPLSNDECKKILSEEPTVVKTQYQETELSSSKAKDIAVSVTNPEILKQGVFSFSYLTYEVSTQPFGWQVRRREKDFEHLREYLIKHYPTQLVSSFTARSLL